MATSSNIRFEVTFKAPLGEIYSDVINLSFMRGLVKKNASFAVLRINLPPILIQQMMNDLSVNTFSPFRLQIHMISEIDNNRKVRIVFDKPFIVLSVNPLYQLTYKSQKQPVLLILTNPVLHFMSTTTTYNTILENKTALDAISDYENFITATYGNVFAFNKIGTNINVNPAIHEEIFTIPSINDLDMPKYLINNYKPLNSYNTYFFDDFCVNDLFTKDIVCHHLNFYDKAQFKKFDISQFTDVVQSTTKLKRMNFADDGKVLDKENESYVVKLPNGNFINAKQSAASIIQNIAGSSKTENLMEDRNLNVTTNSIIQKKSLSQSIQTTIISTPDDEINAALRLALQKESIKKRFDCFQDFETKTCLPDVFHFGKIYNMESDNLSAYIYTPIAISNMFTRINEKENYLQHSARYSMLKYFES